jgi:hypothetical protein
MSTTKLTPAEVIAVHKKWPDTCMLRVNYDKVRDNAKGDATKKATYWLPVEIRRLTDKWTQVFLSAKFTVLCSSAKLPFGKTKDNANKMSVMFRTLTEKDLEGTDYDAKVIPKLIESQAELCESLSILDEHLTLLYEDIAERADQPKATFKIHSTDSHSFAQKYRKASDDDRANDEIKCVKIGSEWKVPLETHSYRLNMPADPQSHKIGKKFPGEKIKHVVFDSRKSNKNNKWKPVPARVKSGGNMVDLDTYNAHHFITYMSMATFNAHLQSICSSPQGLSPVTEFRTLSVWPHKPMVKNELDEDDYDEMANMGASGFNDDQDVDDIDEPDGEEKKENIAQRVKTRPRTNIKMGKKEVELTDDSFEPEPDEYDADDAEADDADVADYNDDDADYEDDNNEEESKPAPKKKPAKPAAKKTPPKRGANRLKSGSRKKSDD